MTNLIYFLCTSHFDRGVLIKHDIFKNNQKTLKTSKKLNLKISHFWVQSCFRSWRKGDISAQKPTSWAIPCPFPPPALKSQLQNLPFFFVRKAKRSTSNPTTVRVFYILSWSHVRIRKDLLRAQSKIARHLAFARAIFYIWCFRRKRRVTFRLR